MNVKVICIALYPCSQFFQFSWNWRGDEAKFAYVRPTYTHIILTLIDYHSNLMNVTAHLAVNIRYLPNFPFDWSDTQHQRSHQSLTVDDFLPSKDDAQQLQQRATHYLMEFLVEYFSDLAHLQKFVPPSQPLHPPMKSEVVPMKILFKDEKLKSDRIDIFSQLLTGWKPQVAIVCIIILLVKIVDNMHYMT